MCHLPWLCLIYKFHWLVLFVWVLLLFCFVVFSSLSVFCSSAQFSSGSPFEPGEHGNFVLCCLFWLKSRAPSEAEGSIPNIRRQFPILRRQFFSAHSLCEVLSEHAWESQSHLVLGREASSALTSTSPGINCVTERVHCVPALKFRAF